RLLTLFLAKYSGNPTVVPINGAAFFDVRLSATSDGRALAAAPQDTHLVLSFRFPTTQPDEVLQFFDPVAGIYKPVLRDARQSTSVVIVDPITGLFTVQLDQRSPPPITALGGTVFTVALPAPPPPIPIVPPVFPLPPGVTPVS